MVYIHMDNVIDKKNNKNIKDALGRDILASYEDSYYVVIDTQVKNVDDFFNHIEKQIKKYGYIKCFKKSPKTKNSTIVKVNLKKSNKFISTSNPSHFAILNRILTDAPGDELSPKEWVNIKYTGYAGVVNPRETFIRLCDIHAIEYNGIEYNI